jgi:ribosomal protein S6
MPDSAELEEIKKLPNFDEAVMRELILGKESKK